MQNALLCFVFLLLTRQHPEGLVCPCCQQLIIQAVLCNVGDGAPGDAMAPGAQHTAGLHAAIRGVEGSDNSTCARAGDVSVWAASCRTKLAVGSFGQATHQLMQPRSQHLRRVITFVQLRKAQCLEMHECGLVAVVNCAHTHHSVREGFGCGAVACGTDGRLKCTAVVTKRGIHTYGNNNDNNSNRLWR